MAGLDDAVAAIKKSGASTFIIQPSPFTYTQRARVIDAANKYRLGTIYGFPIAAETAHWSPTDQITSTCIARQVPMSPGF